MNLKHLIFSKLIPLSISSMILKHRDFGNGIVLMYHDVLCECYNLPSWMIVSAENFAKQMVFIQEHFQIITIKEAICLSRNRVNQGKPFAVITFDDGYSGNYSTVLPIIEKMQIPITVYVATGALENNQIFWYDRIISLLSHYPKLINVDLSSFGLGKFPLNRECQPQSRWNRMQQLLSELKTLSPRRREVAVAELLAQFGEGPRRGQMLLVEELAKLAASPWVTVGGHSHCHNILTQLSEAELSRTLSVNRLQLQKWTEQEVNHFSYPNGTYDERVIAAVKKTGFESAMTTKTGWWGRAPDLYRLNRFGVGRFDSLSLFAARLAQLTK